VTLSLTVVDVWSVVQFLSIEHHLPVHVTDVTVLTYDVYSC